MLLPKALKSDYGDFLKSVGFREETSERESASGRTRYVAADKSKVAILMDISMSENFKVHIIPDEDVEELEKFWRIFAVQLMQQESESLGDSGGATGWAVQIKTLDQETGETVWINEGVETGWPIYRTQEQAEQASETHQWRGQVTRVMPVKVLEMWEPSEASFESE